MKLWLWLGVTPMSVHRWPLTVPGLVLASWLVVGAPQRAIAHAGHGNEFQSDPAASSSAIEVDGTTAERLGIQVETVARRPMPVGLQATGQVETLPNEAVNVTNPLRGTVVRLLVQPGESVVAGQGLLVMSSPELAELRVTSLEKRAEAEADVRQAEAEMRLAENNLDRQRQVATAELREAQSALRTAQDRYERDRELLDSGAIARRQYLESESAYTEAQATVTKASSRLEVLEAETQVQRARSDIQVARDRMVLSDAAYQLRLEQLGASANPDGTITVTAPISGTVADQPVSLGSSVEDAGTVLLTLVNGSAVSVTANIYEKDLGQLSVGQAVRVRPASGSGQVFNGRIDLIGAVVADTRTVPVRVALSNDAGLLKPGQFVTLEIITDQTPNPTIALPRAAIVDANGQPTVYVQNGQSFEPVAVTLGQESGEQIEITEGLFEGDRVVTQGAPLLYAQSLRGGTATEEAHDHPPETVAPNWVKRSQPFGLAALAAGGIALAFWGGRRSASRGAIAVQHALDAAEPRPKDLSSRIP